MSKIIKKQLKRSMPWFLILCIISALVVGAAFNFDINLRNFSHISFEKPEVNANSDTATTTITILNSSPTFSVAPIEVFDTDGSTSTTPVNASSSIGFRATPDDPEFNDSYLIVCSTSTKATANNGAAPTCAGGAANTFCTSAVTAHLSVANCFYNSATSTLPETVEWWAFLCDNHPTQAACSNASQGSGYATGATSSSPFYLNHQPTISIATTSTDNLDPGQDFYVTATSTDTDVLGGVDTLTMSVCSSNSYSTSTGCTESTLCSASATSTNPATCNFNVPAPKQHGAFQYYVFLKDWHDLPATNNPFTPNLFYHVNDVAPVVGDVTLNNGSPITINLRGATTTLIVASTTVNDQNECLDLVSATSTIKYAESDTSTYECTADNNDCYKTTSCVYSGCVASSSLAYVTCTTTLEFYSIPTDAGYLTNPYNIGTWRAQIGVHDELFYSYGTSSSGVELNTTSGLAVTENGIDYGTLSSLDNSGSINATTTIVNYGNSPLNTTISVSNMSTSTYQIPDSSQGFSLSNFSMPGGATWWGSSTTPPTVDTICARPQSSADVYDEVYWGIEIPGGTHSGDYKGTNTFLAAVDSVTTTEW